VTVTAPSTMNNAPTPVPSSPANKNTMGE
jgi:hypothetical protein